MKTKIKILSVLLLIFTFFSNTNAGTEVEKKIYSPYKIKVKIKNTACSPAQVKVIEKDFFNKTKTNCNY
jgi:hypothetical protein